MVPAVHTTPPQHNNHHPLHTNTTTTMPTRPPQSHFSSASLSHTRDVHTCSDCGQSCAQDPCCTVNCTLPVGVACSPQVHPHPHPHTHHTPTHTHARANAMHIYNFGSCPTIVLVRNINLSESHRISLLQQLVQHRERAGVRRGHRLCPGRRLRWGVGEMPADRRHQRSAAVQLPRRVVCAVPKPGVHRVQCGPVQPVHMYAVQRIAVRAWGHRRLQGSWPRGGADILDWLCRRRVGRWRVVRVDV